MATWGEVSVAIQPFYTGGWWWNGTAWVALIASTVMVGGRGYKVFVSQDCTLDWNNYYFHLLEGENTILWDPIPPAPPPPLPPTPAEAYFEKPSWLRGSLESGWLNWNRGDWVDWGPVTIPPFSFTPGKWIEIAIDWLLGPVNYTWSRIIGAWLEVGKIWNIIIDQLGKIWSWWLDVGGWLWGELSGVFSWVTTFVVGIAGSIRTWVLDMLPGYFTDLREWVWGQLDELDAIWESKWSPLKPLLDFVNAFGKKAADFFNDPIGWFAAVFEDGFKLFLATAGWPFLKAIETFLVRIWDEED